MYDSLNMANYDVIDEVSLGEAVWLSRSGDSLTFKEGTFGRVVVKGGCTLVFPRGSNASLAQVHSMGGGSVDLISPRWAPENIKSVFVYRKKLPFNLRVTPERQYLHPTGVMLKLRGHDSEVMSLTTEGTIPAEQQLPKAVVDIEVPRTEDVDPKALTQLPTTGERSNLTDELLQRLLHGSPDGLPFGDVEYVAVWALNHFLRRYAMLSGLGAIRGLSLSEFRDGLIFAHKKPGPNDPVIRNQIYVANYSNERLGDAVEEELSRQCVETPDYTVGEYVEFALEHINYSMAIVSMVELLEANTKGKPWDSLKRSDLSSGQKRNVAEAILCRNLVLHKHECSVNSTADGFAKASKTYNVRALSEYRIYATALPWHWYRDGILPLLAEIRTEHIDNLRVRPEAIHGA